MAILDTLFGGSSQAELLGGLLGEDKLNQLRSQATQTGLINAAIGYLAQPKNQRFGSALPYLARAFTAGQQGAQGVYDDALRNYQTQAQLTEAKRKQDQQVKLQEMLAGIEDPQERLFASIAPDQYVAGKLRTRQAESPFAKIDPKDYTPESFTAYVKTGDITQLKPKDTTKDKTPSYTDAYKNLAITMFGTDNPNELTPVQRKQLDDTVRQRNLERPPQTVVMTPRQVFQDEQALRKEYTAIPEVKLFGEVQNAFDTIKTSLTKQSPAGDLAGATKFMKLLDPSSVVRESELGMAMAATGALDRALNYFNMLKSGQKLSPTQRADFLDLSNQLYEAARQRKSAFDTQYADIASQNQLNPSNVVRGWKPSGGWSIKEKK